MCTRRRPREAGGRVRQLGLTLVELVIFIVVVSAGVAGILSVMNLTTSHSADPMLRKQALSVAEALLEEIELQPFTDCDPDGYDPVANTCTQAEAMGPEAGEARGSFDNVNDYAGLALAGISTLADPGTVILSGYGATVAVANPVGGEPSLTADPSHTLRITVTVTAPDGTSVALDGYRTRYAPRG